MEMALIIDTLVGLVIGGLAYFLSNQAKELKRVEVLLSRTREDYATRNDLRDDMSRLVEALHRVEDKLDRALSKE
jgi:hypothetical protein